MFSLQLCVKFVFSLQQSRAEFLDTWGLLCALGINEVDCSLQERVEAVEHVVVVEAEDVMSLEQLVESCHCSLSSARDRLLVHDDVEPVIEITFTIKFKI